MKKKGVKLQPNHHKSSKRRRCGNLRGLYGSLSTGAMLAGAHLKLSLSVGLQLSVVAFFGRHPLTRSRCQLMGEIARGGVFSSGLVGFPHQKRPFWMGSSGLRKTVEIARWLSILDP